MPPAHLTPSATPEDITCLVPAGSVLTSRDPLPPSTTPGSQANSSQSGSSQTDKSPNIECVVCGDKSSGKHYGQFTCEDVKARGTEAGRWKGGKETAKYPELMRGRKRPLRMIEEGSEQDGENLFDTWKNPELIVGMGEAVGQLKHVGASLDSITAACACDNCFRVQCIVANVFQGGFLGIMWMNTPARRGGILGKISGVVLAVGKTGRRSTDQMFLWDHAHFEQYIMMSEFHMDPNPFPPLYVLVNYKAKLFRYNYVDNGECNGNGMNEDDFSKTIKDNCRMEN
ncbi:Nuclear receptor subfamily 2 group F member 1-A [Acromyrmex echinatior]|uniref:Nuclear receptor subfamily 2 group F member 1-A n=1 Tax=Acromyrmex echinatior TaxID=103372 RepID=F4WVF8_ACREC|nr:Nuclear receptor subfamily 2 group F member 1-A [Acromyrmex echinatior]